MIGSQLRRVATAVVAAGILAGGLASVASAGDTRFVFIGSALPADGCAQAIANPARVGSLTTTDFSRGGQFRVDVVAKNCGGNNLTNVQFTVGRDPGALDVLAAPFTTADGFKVSEILTSAPSDLKCNSVPTTLLSCTLKALRAGESLSVSLVITTTTASTANTVYAALKAKENTNDGGANQDTMEATTGTLTPSAFSCDSIKTFFSPKVSEAGTCELGTGNPQTGKIKYNLRSLPVEVAEVVVSNAGLAACTDGNKTPIGNDLKGDITGEASGDTVTWTIQIDLKALNRNGVKDTDVKICHWDDAGNLSAPTGTPSISKNNKSILTVIFTTNGNGKTRLLG